MKLKEQTIDLGLSGYDELFTTEQERADTRKPKVEELPLTELTPFKNHPFKVKNDAEMAELMKSITYIRVREILQRAPQCCRRVYEGK